MSVQFGGLVSGMNTNQMITQLVALERQPVNKMNIAKRGVQNDLRAIGDMTAKLKALEGAAKDLSTVERFMSFSGQSTKSDALKVSAGPGASAASFDVSVEQLARPARVRSDAFESSNHTFDEGMMTISVFGEDDVEISVPQGATLSEVRDLIRGSGAKVSASLVDSGSGVHLNVTSTKTGHEPGNVSGALGLSFAGIPVSTTQEAQNARFTIDGLEVDSPSNLVSSAVEGVTFELLGVAEDIKANIAPDRAAVLEKAKAFVDAYNGAVDAIRKQSDSGNKRRFEGDLNQAASQAVVSGPFVNLRAIGIAGSSAGKLELDETIFLSKMDEDSVGVAEVFAGSNGVASRMLDQVSRYTKSSGILKGVESALNGRDAALTGQIERKERSIESYENRLRRRFATLEQLLVNLNDQSASYSALVPPSFNSNNR